MPGAANASAEYLKIQPLGKIPAFEGANGFTLSEVIAISIYCMLMTSVFFPSSDNFYFSTCTHHPQIAPCFS